MDFLVASVAFLAGWLACSFSLVIACIIRGRLETVNPHRPLRSILKGEKTPSLVTMADIETEDRKREALGMEKTGDGPDST